MKDQDFLLVLQEAEKINGEIEKRGAVAVMKYKSKLPALSKMIISESKRRLKNGAGE